MTIYTDIQQNKFITPNLGRAKNTPLEGLNLPIIIVDELLPLIQIITPSSKSNL